MNITIDSNTPLAVTVHLTFKEGNGQLLEWVFNADLSGYIPLTHTVVGRTPQEVVGMELEYNSMRYAWPIEVSSDGMNLKTIDIQNGRDQWSQLLREKALSED